MSSLYNGYFTSSLSIWILLFLFLVWLLWLRLPILVWREVVRVSIFVLFQMLAGRLSAFHCWVLVVGLSWICLIILWYVSSITIFIRVFFLSWIDVEFYQMLFLHLLRLSCVFCLLLMWCIPLICESWTILWHWHESKLVVVHDLYNVLLDLVCQIS